MLKKFLQNFILDFYVDKNIYANQIQIPAYFILFEVTIPDAKIKILKIPLASQSS